MLKLIVNFSVFLFLIQPSLSQNIKAPINKPTEEAERLTKLQWKHYSLGDYKTFKVYTDSILKLSKAHDLKEFEIDAVIRLGVYYKKIGEYEQSMKYYTDALNLSDNIENYHKKKIVILINLGNVYNIIGSHNKALKAFEEAQQYVDKFGGPDAYKMAIYTGKSDCFLGNKNFKMALSYLEKSKEIVEKLDRDDMRINVLNSMADVYIKLKRFNKSLVYSKKAAALYNAKESIQQRALSLSLIGTSLIELDSVNQAIAPLQMAQGIAITNQFVEIEMNVHKNLAKAFEKQGNLKKAIEEQKGYGLAKEKYLLSLSKAKRLEVTQELTKTENLLKKETIFKRYYIVFSFLIGFALITMLFIYKNKRKKAELNAIQLKENQILLKDENEVLKTKIINFLEQKNTSSTTKKTSKTKKSSLSKEEQDKYVQLILEYMEEEKPYLDPYVKQKNIAEKLNLSIHVFSEILNICFQKNFNNFINLYRVDYAKQLIRNPKYENYKILTIGYESGFPSKSSFNRIFKQLTEQTPSEYRIQY